MSGWSSVPGVRDHVISQSRTEGSMIARFGRRDPFWDDGRGARRRNLVRRMEAQLALAIAIVACGLTLAAWLQTLLPVVRQLGLG
jgi:hypothetical protein